MHKEVMQQLIQQQKKMREGKEAERVAAEKCERDRLEMAEQREAAEKVERERLAELELSKVRPIHSSPNASTGLNNHSLFASRPISFNMEDSTGEEVDYSSSDFTITDESSNQSMLDTVVLLYDSWNFFFYSQVICYSSKKGGSDASNNNNKRPYHLVIMPPTGSSITPFQNSSELVL